MVTCPETPTTAALTELQWLRGRVAGLEAQCEILTAQLAARDAQLEAAHAQLAVLAKQTGELQRRLAKEFLHVVEAAILR